MATVILQRHGRTTANAGGVLAGRTPGVRLDETGERQARDAAARLAVVPLAALVSSPQERCLQTASYVAAHRPPDAPAPEVEVDEGLAECDYGDWQGSPIAELAKDPLWKVVQQQPSAVRFPGGETLRAMQQRAVDAVRRRDAEVAAAHGDGAVWLAVTHGDIVKALLADALGLHLDLFQRLHADPASLTVIRYTAARPMVLQTNTHSGDLSWLAAPPAAAPAAGAAEGDAVVGGGAGPGTPPPAL
ncbi:MSMEG_4193 family putative phosphomutase [Nocardioides sp. CPCC 205120]|uniref:MSMEG_4193 family putative phosphomutase n=1 Tax=Nocardioides sp. CPCC 205120 TaxID=3406462 RepID=UPI003B50186D